MFASFGSFSIPKFRLGRSNDADKIDVAPVQVHNVETETDKRGRSIKHLLKLNHANFSILYNHLRFHNHTPHLLGSAYLQGASADHLNDIYEDAAAHEGHEPWKDSPSEIALHDYRDFLGLREYQRAWVDFFEDQLVMDGGYDWRKVVAKFLFEAGSTKRPNPIPIVQSIVAGLGHPLIHLGYAYELNSRDVAMEALGLAAACYDPKLASIVDSNLSSLKDTTPPYSTSDPFEILAKCRSDKRFDGLFTHPGGDNLSHLLADDKLVSILLEHWSAWHITNPKQQFEQSQQLATALLISTAPSLDGHGYDFFLVHLLTTSHAVRIILPEIEAQHHLSLLREWWLITLAIYIAQLRPHVDKKDILNYNLDGRTWQTTTDLALSGNHKFDAHYVKAIRAMKEAAKVWGDDDDQYYLKAAVRFSTEFSQWGGFGAEDVEGTQRQGSPH